MSPKKNMKVLKTLQVSFRVTKAFKNSLEALAARANRSQANMLDVILGDYLARNPLNVPVVSGKPSKKKATRKR